VPSTSLLIAGAGANNADAGNVAWSNPGRVTSSDGSLANSELKSTGATTQYLHATNFGFSIPSNAIIDGIVARVMRSVNVVGNGQASDHTVQLIVGGIRSGSNNAAPGNWVKGNPANADYGGSADAWGLSLTASNVNSSNFGLAVRAQSTLNAPNCQVDAIWLQIYYSQPKASIMMHSYRQRRV